MNIENPLQMVSVIVPCRNEAKWIEKCLSSIAANDFPNERLEVLVLDGMVDYRADFPLEAD